MFQKRSPPVGARPGTLSIPPGSPPPEAYVMSYSQEGVEEHPVTDFATLHNDEDRVNWVDVRGLGDEDTLRRIADAFGIHPLALEDAVNLPQRAKAELYDENMLIIARVPIRDAAGALEVPQVAMFVGRGYVVTFQESSRGLFDPVRERIRAGTGPIWTMKADYLAYALLDTMIDRYYPVVEDIVAELDDLEAEVIDDPTPAMLTDIYRIRRALVLLRRVGWPQRSAIHDLYRDESPFISAAVRTYLRDTHDHIAQVVELVDSSRDVTLAVMDMYLSTASNKTNDIMKVLTLMASIFIPLTFMAGLYGMNFENMPELQEPWAYPILILAMGIVAVGMLIFFAKRGWLGRARRRKRPRDR